MPKLVNGLSQKMKNFCHAYAQHGNASQAYFEAYDCHNEYTAYKEGHLLLKRDDITEYLEKINRPTVNKITNEREKKRKLLWKAIERCDAKEDESGLARYMDILNKMDAEYVNINRNIDDSSEKLSGLEMEQLIEILGNNTAQNEQ
jgi:phage terminase small subunit